MSTTKTVSVPAGVVDGDFLIAMVTNLSSGGVSTPSGWTMLGSVKTWSYGYGSAVFYRVANSEPSSYVFGSGTSEGFMAAYRGATAIDVSGSWQEVSGNSMTFTGISTSANSMLLALLMDRDGPGVGININLTATTGLTQRLNGGGYYFQGGLAELLNADSSNRIWTTTSSQFIANGILFSII